MHNEKRTRNTRLRELKQLYLEELKDKTRKAFEPEIQNGIVSERELDEQVLDYYRRTTPSLQEFYSRYTPEWESFVSAEPLNGANFLDFLRRMRPAFARRYEAYELNVDYYLQRWRELETATERAELKEFFLDKWHRLLNAKEFEYQFVHIHSLCDAFYLLKMKAGLEVNRPVIGTRNQWLLRNHPALYKSMATYETAMKKNTAIRALTDLLGRRNRQEKRGFDSFSGISTQRLVSRSSHSDITGFNIGNDLNNLLPIEYGFFADDRLRPLFLQRYAEKQLQMFDHRSTLQAKPSPTPRLKSVQGPFIICVDTSGSMVGERERLSKSAILAIAQLTERTHRQCFVINFSEDAVALKIDNLASDFPKLVDFLNQSFHGGTDIEPALTEAARIIRANRFYETDVVLISDFEMPVMSKALEEEVAGMKRKRTRFYSLVFGNHAEPEYLNLCDRYWEM